MFAAQHSNERHARTAPSQRAHWKKVKHHKVALSHACDLAGHLNVRLLEARLAAGTAESLRNLLLFRSFFSLLRPEFGACIFIRSDIRSDMVQRCPSACTPRPENTQNSAEAGGGLLTSPGDGTAPARRRRAHWSRGSRRRLLQEKIRFCWFSAHQQLLRAANERSCSLTFGRCLYSAPTAAPETYVADEVKMAVKVSEFSRNDRSAPPPPPPRQGYSLHDGAINRRMKSASVQSLWWLSYRKFLITETCTCQ